MALFKYVHYVKHNQTESKNVFKLPTNVSALSCGELKEVNSQVSKVAQSKSLSSMCISRDHVNYNKYTPEQRASYDRAVCCQKWTNTCCKLPERSIVTCHVCMHACSLHAVISSN